MILTASGVLNDRPATTKHEVTRNPAARGNALNYPRIDVRGMMLVDRGQAAEFRSAPTPRCICSPVCSTSTSPMKPATLWNISSHLRACCVLASLPTGPRWCNVRAADTDRCNLPYSSPQLIAPAGRDGAQLTGIAMRNRKRSSPDVLKTSAAFAAGVLFAVPVRAAAPPRAQSECRPPVPEFLLRRGGKTIVARQFRLPLVPCGNQAKARSPTAVGAEIAQIRSGRRCWRRARKSKRATLQYSRCDRIRRRRITFAMS
jgi:hypothetical protein